MGGEGYALERALSDAALAQLRSREKRARSDLPRRSPSEIYEVSRRAVGDCMEKTGFNDGDAGMRRSTRVSQISSSVKDCVLFEYVCLYRRSACPIDRRLGWFYQHPKGWNSVCDCAVFSVLRLLSNLSGSQRF